MRKTVPYLFLGLLCIVLFFVIGVRYGQSVQKANQTVPTPTGAPSATPAPPDKPLRFNSFSHEGCRLSFLYPSSLEIDRTATNGAMFRQESRIALSFDCDPKRRTVETATDGAKLTFQKRAITAQLKEGMYLFSLRHPVTGRIIVISADQSLYPLLEKSLAYEAE